MSSEILVYITSNKERIISSGGLAVYITDEEEKEKYIADVIKTFGAIKVVKMTNGDYMMVSN